MSRQKNTKLEKLKHAKKRKRIIRISFFLAVVVFCAIMQICNSRKFNLIQINNKKSLEAQKEDNSLKIATSNEVINNNIEDDKNENKIAEVQNQIEPKEYESTFEEVKQEVETYMAKNHLNENNFAIFYYQPNNNDYFTFNENKYFTAASTIKVPLAMIYYEKINQGELSPNSVLTYKSTDYEAGTGGTSVTYKIGDQIPISFLLNEMIINSDNTATQILKHGLGSDETYRKLISKYAKRQLPDNFYDENVICAAFGYDVISYLYENQRSFEELINNMKKSSNGGYLKKNVNVEIAHKYGSYERNIHDFGIVYAKNNYLVGIFTFELEDSEKIISELNQILLKINEK